MIFQKEEASFIQNEDSGAPKTFVSFLEPAKSDMISWLQLETLKSMQLSSTPQDRCKTILTDSVDQEILSAERAILATMQLLDTKPYFENAAKAPHSGREQRPFQSAVE